MIEMNTKKQGCLVKSGNKGDKKGEKMERRKEETVSCGDMTRLKLGVRCHSEAPGCLIFHRVIPALWIWSDCPLKTSVMRSPPHLSDVHMTELLYLPRGIHTIPSHQ